MARMGHDSERAAIIYQHEARGADAAITDAIDAHVESEQGKGGDDGGASGAIVHAG
jgi:CubicO group peptidase (beta-lactamase class C family)